MTSEPLPTQTPLAVAGVGPPVTATVRGTLPGSARAPGADPEREAGPVDALRGEAQATPAGSVLVVGLDLSLRRTGVATHTGAMSVTPPKELDGLRRLRWIRHVLVAATHDADLVVVERITYSTTGKYAKENAGLWYVVMTAIDARQIRWIDVVSNTRALYATGDGRADKETVFAEAIRRLPIQVANNDEADAAWMCALGHDLLGEPLINLPARNRKALDTVRARNSDVLSTITGDQT